MSQYTLAERSKMEWEMFPFACKGYSRKVARVWYKKRKRDAEAYRDVYDQATIRQLHQDGFLCSTVQHYGLKGPDYGGYVSDFDYRFLWPYNNSFSKWIEDILTTNRVLRDHQDVCRRVYFSIVRRSGRALILPIGGDERQNTVEDVMACVREHGRLELRPSFWTSLHRRYQLRYEDGAYYIGGRKAGQKTLAQLLRRVGAEGNYVIADYVDPSYTFEPDMTMDHSLKLWIGNDAGEKPEILSAVMNLYWNKPIMVNGKEATRRVSEALLLDLEQGTFRYQDRVIRLKNWDKVVSGVQSVCAAMQQLTYFSMSIALREDGGFTLLHFADYPKRPVIPYHDKLNRYLRQKANLKRKNEHLKLGDHITSMRNGLFRQHVEKHCRQGIRPYMQRLWNNAVKDDWLHTRGVSLKQKRWAHQHGFLSYRIWQYGLTEDNYRNFLSDYDYYWLNRINNNYQKWVNDKTTYRLILEPFKQYLPKYYLSVFKRDGAVELARMWDCPEHIHGDVDGLLQLLREEKMLAFKPSAGTHGDGFYCLAYEDGQYLVNGEATDAQGIAKLLAAQKSFYVVTEYLVMHDELRKIYPRSVNTVRVMVINRRGNEPKIMQTYMRIGSSSTGFTDNVGYGGICVMIDRETGRLYQPETIQKHSFHDCPVHPDTGVPIAGTLPHWELLRSTVLEIARYLGELEYLGFDVAITNEGLCILEINIHQDLHKVADFTDEMKDFFDSKIRNKMRVDKKKDGKEKEKEMEAKTL